MIVTFRRVAPALVFLAAIPIPVLRAGAYTFQTLNNPTDPTFNQLLGINNAGTIAGYYGSGAMGHPNQGYVLAPPYGAGNYTSENFPASVQTQVVGINNNGSPVTVGFWADGNGNNIGFVDQSGTFSSVINPSTPAMGTTVNQLLSVNDNGIAAGFYIDGMGNAQAYLYNIAMASFTPIVLPGAFNAVMTTATGVNNAGLVSGFYVDSGGVVHGFLDNGGTFTSLDDPSGNGTNTTVLGLNNLGFLVGSYVDSAGVTNGFLYNLNTNSWQSINDPNQSATPAFDVTGTTVNGVNDLNQLVGFFSDGTNVNGFLASPLATPEPTTLGLMTLGGVVGILLRRRTG